MNMNTLSENLVTMSLEEFLELRDDAKFKADIEAFARDSRIDYGDRNRRDTSEIGYRVLSILNLPVVYTEDDENVETN